MSDDLIRRSDASKLCIDIVNEFLKSGEFVHLNEAMAIGERFKELPTAEPKRGEWIDDDFVGQYRCSECDYYAIDEYDCCPNCGADMREREGE